MVVTEPSTHLSERLAAVIRSLPGGVLVEDERRRIALVNDDFIGIFGIPASPEQLVGTDCSASAEQSKELMAHPETFPLRVAEILAAGEPVRNERIDFADGRVFERDYVPLSVDEEHRGHLWTYRDVTGRTREADEILRCDTASTALLEISSDHEADETTRFNRLLDAGRDLFGLPIAAVTRVRGADAEVLASRDDSGALTPGATMPLSDLYCSVTARKRSPIAFERASGTPWAELPAHEAHPFECYAGAPIVVAGQTWGTLGFADFEPRPEAFTSRELNLLGLMAEGLSAEIERRQTADDLARSQARAIAQIQTALDAIITIDRDERVIEFNPAAEQMFGRRNADVVGMTLSELIIPPEMRDAHSRGIQRFLETREPVALNRRLELPAIHADGSRLLVELAATAIEADGEVVAFTAYLRDIGERKQFEAELAEARDKALEATRLKSQYLATISHELRTPMNGVIAALDLLKDTEMADEQTDLVQVMSDSSEVLLRILNDLLDTAKVEEGRLALVESEFDVRDAIESAVEGSSAAARLKGIKLFGAIDMNVPSIVTGDALRLRQILTNLIGNAVKFTDSGEVTVHTRLTGSGPDGYGLSVAVSDSGPGISATDLDRLFRPFAQVEDGMTARHGGAGLGLVISRSLARLMGGDISLESSEGEGTTATATFTLRGPDLSSPRAPLAGIHAVVGSERHRLADITAAKLRSLGAQVTVAMTRRELFGAEEAGADVTIVDWAWADAAGGAVISIDGPMSSNIPRMPAPIRDARLAELILGAMSDTGGRTNDAAPPRGGSTEAAGDDVPAEPQATSPVDILIAEDSSTNRMLLQRQIERLGLTADAVENGREAVRAAVARPYRVVLMDMRMPEMDGITAARAIRASERPGTRVPIIAITANAAPDDRVACLAAGMDGHLGKPLTIDTLRAALAPYIGGLNSAPEQEPVAEENSITGTLGDLVEDLGGRESVSSLISRWEGELEKRLAALGDAVADGDQDQISALAHTLRGAGGIFGIEELTEPCKALESGLSRSKAERVQADIERIARRATQTMRDWRDAPVPAVA